MIQKKKKRASDFKINTIYVKVNQLNGEHTTTTTTLATRV